MPLVQKKKQKIPAGIGPCCLEGTIFASWMKDVAARLKRYDHRFDSIVCRGKSGMLAAGYLSVVLEKDIVLIRKSTRNTHTSDLVEYRNMPKRYIIVDDFISSGATMQNILQKMDMFFPKAELVAIVLYDGDEEYEYMYESIMIDDVALAIEGVACFTPDAIYNESMLHLENGNKKKKRKAKRSN